MLPAAIGPYQIVRELGRGGMGEVHLAHDSRLDRQVAIKALPAHLALDPDRLARFQREAKVLASLNHPAIGAIYGLEEANGHQYLILEYVDGQTLADRINKGPIPVDDALVIAKQIAEALEAAHEKGVIHRDLKPGNVMVTSDGAVKVLDFGLARSEEGAPSSGPLAAPDSPTLTTPVRMHSPTIPGVIMGTAGYMSPEQARGRPVDKRSDIFSFGCVLYEMLAGAMPFQGETTADAIGATLHKEADLGRLPATTPRRVRDLLSNCLAKDRRNRLHDIGDARLELERAIAGQEWSSAAPSGSARKRSGLMSGALAVAVAALAGCAGWYLARSFARLPPSTPAQAFHVSTAVPTTPELGWVIGISPDARFVVYMAWPPLESESVNPEGALAVRRLDRDESTVIEGTQGAMDAALSADGRWIAFAAAKDRARSKITLKKIALDNGRAVGAPETLCDLPPGGGMSVCWASDREIVVALSWQQTILAVSASGGEPRVVRRDEQSKEIDAWGEVNPLVDGESILASRWALVGDSIKERTEVVELATGKRTPLLQNSGGAQALRGIGRSGEATIIARRTANSLIAARLDLTSMQVIGEPVTVWSGSLRSGFRVSDNGTMAMTPGGDFSARKLMWIDEQGLPQPVGAPPRAYGEISVSPDGGRIATYMEPSDEAELSADLWIQDLSRRTFTRLATQGSAFAVRWSRDGQRIAHANVRDDEFSIWTRRADGSGEAAKIYTGPGSQMLVVPCDWSPDGRALAITQVDLANDAADVLILEQKPDSNDWIATPYLNSSAGEDFLRFSPDGRWVRFLSNESGRMELYVQRYTGAASGAEDARSGRHQISTNGARGGGWWSADGKEIRYIDNDFQIMSVEVQTEPTFSTSLPKPLASFKGLKAVDFSFASDGRLILVVEGENERPSRIDLVINFAEEVRAKTASAE